MIAHRAGKGKGLGRGMGLVGTECARPHYTRCSRAKKGVKNNVTGVGAGQYDFSKKLFGLLCWMCCVFWHRPKWDSDIIPKIRGAGVPIVSILGFIPILWFSVNTVGGNHPSAHFYRLQIEGVLPPLCRIPYILHAVFPIKLCTPPLFPLPGDAVLYQKKITQYPSNNQAGFPVAANINRGVIF